ncbi:Trk K+ transport system NAD-binding subunit [Plasticicumulans lactativorans]|uniref:Trk K+ transport system NAD-binding subunit n=1 Tax=Plasticicumulans lactativorans TaxID=1133106 RepID=A0A4R2L0Z6_9GAMM|nr:potassium channel protein [Plasticicumulans lactativorans]TCO79242.1 Trk K+ transport system NAD-binding subunit [Plasticicumulans lactativorans]
MNFVFLLLRRRLGTSASVAPAPATGRPGAAINSVVFIFLRRMRQPLLVLIAVYAVSIAGLVAIPGLDADGREWRFDLFHAFYFISYTGSTIGFGEVPHAFTAAQRLWVTVCIYLTVIGWLYAVGNILNLIGDPAFRRALAENRFGRKVRGLSEPFYVVCGYGETGNQLVRALCRRGVQPVVIDGDAERLAALDLEDLGFDVPALAADAREVRVLELAGLHNPNCRGVVAASGEDAVDVKVAIAARLLNPQLTVVARAEHAATAADLHAFGTAYVIDPFATFGEHMAMALRAPSLHMLFEYLIRVPGHPLPAHIGPPHGRWIICGYGRFGRATQAALVAEGVPYTVIEADPARAPAGAVVGTPTEAGPLRQAGIDEAVGIIAGTDDDTDNLAIAIAARALNPALYIVARQARRANDPLFAAAGVDLVISPSRITVWRIIAALTHPLLNDFLGRARAAGEGWSCSLLARLEVLCAGLTPDTWEVTIDAEQAPAVHDTLGSGRTVRIDDVLRDPEERKRRVPAVVLVLLREGAEYMLPAPDTELRRGDTLLLAARAGTADRMRWVLCSNNALEYALDGVEHPDGTVWRWLARRRAARAGGG